MANNDAFDERRRAHEEGYFAKKDRELLEKLRARAEESAARRQMGESAGIVDEAVVADLEALGFTRETVSLLHLVPLVQLAWASGSVKKSERSAIVEAARSRGITEGSAADQALAGWLDSRPADEFFAGTLRAIRAVLAGLPELERESNRADLISDCMAIAAVSGGVLGLGSKVCDQERALIEHLAAELAQEHGEAAEAINQSLD